MKAAKDVIPWKVTEIAVRPYDGYWSFNPSIHFDGETWRCVLRCCDYAMPDGITIRSKNARITGQQTKNAMVVFDPTTWEAVQIFKIHEKDGLPRESCPHVGFEDVRLFRTDKGGLQGIAASLHLRREQKPRAASDVRPQLQPPEQVLLTFDPSYDIVAVQPIRGDGWSGTPQKNWVPFDHCVEPRFLYSINKGRMFDDHGSLSGERALVRPSSLRSASSGLTSLPVRSVLPVEAAPAREAAPIQKVPDTSNAKPSSKSPARKPPMVRGGDVRIVRSGRMKLDTIASRPSRPAARGAARGSDDAVRMMGSGRMLRPSYEGLRGGTQLIRIAENSWLGLGHEMKFVSGRKYYWHTWYVVDARGRMTSASAPMKLAQNGIEFAAGMAIAGDRVVVSFGVDDMHSMLGETSLSAVLAALKAVG